MNTRKKRTLESLKTDILTSPVIGIVNIEGLPARQFQDLREKFRGDITIKVTKKRLINLAIEEIKHKRDGLEELSENIEGMPALIFTKDNPFKLHRKFERNKTSAPAKAGQVAPDDIKVPSGPTPFAPGPIIGELGNYKIKAKIEKGKIVITNDVIVAKKGDVLDTGLVSILNRLGIKPMEVGLDLCAAFENEVYTRDIFSRDSTSLLKEGIIRAQVLALHANIINETTISFLIKKAQIQALAIKEV